MATRTCKKCGSEMVFVENRKVSHDTYSMYRCEKCNRLVADSG